MLCRVRQTPRNARPDSSSNEAHRVANVIPEIGLLRLDQILGDKRANPPVPPIIPVSRSTWWDGVKSGRFPQPVKIGPRCTAWMAEDIRALVESFR